VRPHILDVRLGVSGAMVASEKSAYLLSLGSSISQDVDFLDVLYPRFDLSLIGTYRSSDTFTLLYGLAYSFVLGRPYPLPVLGFRWALADAWTLSFLLPALLELRYLPAPDWELRVFSALSGGRSRIRNRGEFPGQRAFLYLQGYEVRMGLGAGWRATDWLSLRAEGGGLVARRLEIAAEDSLLKSGVGMSAYLRASLELRFGSASPLEGFRRSLKR
jgi:hypothetical protein